jgi:hypothetical protein
MKLSRETNISRNFQPQEFLKTADGGWRMAVGGWANPPYPVTLHTTNNQKRDNISFIHF